MICLVCFGLGGLGLGTLLRCVAATASEADLSAGAELGLADAIVVVAANDFPWTRGVNWNWLSATCVEDGSPSKGTHWESKGGLWSIACKGDDSCLLGMFATGWGQ